MNPDFNVDLQISLNKNVAETLETKNNKAKQICNSFRKKLIK